MRRVSTIGEKTTTLKKTTDTGIVSRPSRSSLGSNANPTTFAITVVGTKAIIQALKMYFNGESSVSVKIESILVMNALNQGPRYEVPLNSDVSLFYFGIYTTEKTEVTEMATSRHC